MTYNFSSMN